MAFQFIEDVKSVRPNVSEEALQGKTYYSTEALPAGLVDGENTLEEVVEMILKQTTSKQAGPSIDINTINF
jgi:ClpP class serine protease